MKKQLFKRIMGKVALFTVVSMIMTSNAFAAESADMLTGAETSASYSIRVQLLDADQSPYQGIYTWLVGEDDEDTIADSYSDNNGWVKFTGLEGGTYRLRVSVEDIQCGFYEEGWTYMDESDIIVEAGEINEDEIATESNSKESNSKESSSKESSSEESDSKESSTEGSGSEDSSTEESGSEDSSLEESGSEESNLEEISSEEGSTEESDPEEGSTEESSSKEGGSEESGSEAGASDDAKGNAEQESSDIEG